jgi:hypothetical protein
MQAKDKRQFIHAYRLSYNVQKTNNVNVPQQQNTLRTHNLPYFTSAHILHICCNQYYRTQSRISIWQEASSDKHQLDYCTTTTV